MDLDLRRTESTLFPSFGTAVEESDIIRLDKSEYIDMMLGCEDEDWLPSYDKIGKIYSYQSELFCLLRINNNNYIINI